MNKTPSSWIEVAKGRIFDRNKSRALTANAKKNETVGGARI